MNVILLAGIMALATPNAVEIRESAGQSFQAGQFEQTLESLRRLQNTPEFNLGDRLLLAHAYRALGDPRAVALYEDVLQEDEQNADALLGQFFIALDKGNVPKAKEKASHIEGDLKEVTESILEKVEAPQTLAIVGLAHTQDGAFAPDFVFDANIAIPIRQRLKLNAQWNPVGLSATVGLAALYSKLIFEYGVGASMVDELVFARAYLSLGYKLPAGIVFSFAENVEMRPDIFRTLSMASLDKKLTENFRAQITAFVSTHAKGINGSALMGGVLWSAPADLRVHLLAGVGRATTTTFSGRFQIDAPLYKKVRLGLYAQSNPFYKGGGLMILWNR